MTVSIDPGKRAAGYAAVDKFVTDGACIGLGTGTTAYWAIERVGARVASGERIEVVATSSETERLCRQWNVPLVHLLEREMSVAIDGADEVALSDWSLTKGGGGALFREKAVALAAEQFVVIATTNKLVPELGAFPTPVEIVPYSERYVRREIERRAKVEIARRGGDDPFVTDNGNWILDCRFGRIADPLGLDTSLRGIHGVVASGIFWGITTAVIVGAEDGSVEDLPLPAN